MLLTFRALGFGWHGHGILLTSPIQSPKLIAVWTKLEPLPLVVANPAPIILGLVLFGLGHACIYRWLSPAWPPAKTPRALRLAGLIFFLSFLFWSSSPPATCSGPNNRKSLDEHELEIFSPPRPDPKPPSSET